MSAHSKRALSLLARLGQQRGIHTSAAVCGEYATARSGEVCGPIDDSYRKDQGVLNVPVRLLMGPGPGNAHPRVLSAQTLPLLGHMHPPFLHIMDEIQDGLRYIFQTKSKHVLMVSGSGHAGMEACIGNLVEPGDKVLVMNGGIWGTRVCDMAARYEADVVDLKTRPGAALSLEEVTAAIEEHKPALVFTCQGESSTGVHQSLAGIGDVCRKHGALFLVDTVCSLGGVPFYADEWKVDAVYSGSQKVLSGPPGSAPLMLGERAFEKMSNRSSKTATYNLDLTLIGDYWGWYGKRFYHHTPPVSNFYAMREALQVVQEEGLDSIWKRHAAMQKMLWDGLKGMGLEPHVQDPEHQLCTVNTIKVPEGVDWAALNANAMENFSLEIAGGLGPSAGAVWRVGVLGFNAQPQNIQLVLDAFKDGLTKQGFL